MQGSVRDKTVLITGASRGIGRAIANVFAEEGARLGLMATSHESLEPVVAECKAKGVQVHAAPCDITRRDQVQAAVASVREALGPIEILINNAGVGRYAPFLELAEEDWEWMWSVNVKGLVLVTQAVLPDMIAARDGCVINISSMQGLQAWPRTSAYSATKFAVMGISEGLGREMVEHNVRVTAFCPGGVRTDFADVPADTKPSTYMNVEEVARAVLDTVLQNQGNAWVKQVTLAPFM